jgi:DNA-directed RNA polymerase subunit RPC12/RpoP
MKSLIPHGCRKCGGALALEQDGLTRDEDGQWAVEYACTNCGRRVYVRTNKPDDYRTRSYR